MKIKVHKVGNRKCLVAKADGKWMQILFMPSAWKNKYYVITEELEEKKHSCSLHTKAQIIKTFGNVANEIF